MLFLMAMILIRTPHVALVLICCQTQGSFTVQNNIIAHDISNRTYGFAISLSSGSNNDIVTNNIIYQWLGINNDGTGNTISPNAIDQTGYLDPNRYVASYIASLGGPASLAAFLAAADNQSMSNWNAQYTATAVNSYIQSGFSMTGAPASDHCVVLD